MQFQIMLRKSIFVDVVYAIIRIFQFNFICYFVNLEVVRCFIMRRRAITDMPILAWAYEYLLPNKDLSFVLVMPPHLSTIGVKMNRARDEILVSSMNRASSRLLCCEADDFLNERHYARACHAMIEAIDEAGDQNADLRRKIALRIWAVLYGTLWSAGV
jgi:hypothetical protein